MITKMTKKHLADVLAIWLAGNLNGHPFIAANHWQQALPVVAELLPQADIYIYREEQEIKGFIGISQENYLAGLFVKPEAQGNKIGSKLLQYAQTKSASLSLQVYAKNQRGVNFYLAHGFKLISSDLDLTTNEIELSLTWNQS